MCATLPLAPVGSGEKPSLNGAPAVSNMTTVSIAGWALTAVPQRPLSAGASQPVWISIEDSRTGIRASIVRP
jgi:hypothetical protein